MCNCLDLKYSQKSHTHSNYTTQAAVDAAIANAGHIDQTALDAAIASAGHIDQVALDAAIAASGHIDQAALDAAIASAVDAAVPVGSIKLWSGASDPAGGKWMICDGRTLDSNNYPDLYGVIGLSFSIYSHPSTIFDLPDFNGRVPVGVRSGSYAMGDQGGAAQHTLTVGEMPSHSHPMLPGYFPGRDITNPTIAASPGSTWSQGSIGNTGGGQPHNNMPPYLVVNYIIKVLP